MREKTNNVQREGRGNRLEILEQVVATLDRRRPRHQISPEDSVDTLHCCKEVHAMFRKTCLLSFELKKAARGIPLLTYDNLELGKWKRRQHGRDPGSRCLLGVPLASRLVA